MHFNPELVKTILKGFSEDLLEHSRNVCYLSIKLAEYLGHTSEQIKTLAIGALLHDIGKSCIDEGILNKPGRLTEKEFAVIKQHTVLGAKMISHFKNARRYLPIILYHHERWDGKGYEGLSGEEIPELARIVTITDAFDAMTSSRPYQETRTLTGALQELNANKGTQLAPYLVEAFETFILDFLKNRYNVRNFGEYLDIDILLRGIG